MTNEAVAFIDIKQAKVTCSNCLEPIYADIARKAETAVGGRGIAPHGSPLLPERCPTCHNRIPDGLQDDMSALRDIYFRNERRRCGIELVNNKS